MYQTSKYGDSSMMLLRLVFMQVLVYKTLVSALPVATHWDDVIRQRRHAANCQPPQDIKQLFQSLNKNADTSLYFRHVRQGIRPYLHTELNTDQVFDSENYYRGTTCPSSVSDDPQDPLWMRSLCPWYYNVTRLPAGHYPSVIPQAVCKCDRCVDNNQKQCERVSTQIRVLEEIGCENGFYKYKPKTIAHYVGCTCANRRIATLNLSQSSPSGISRTLMCGDYPCTQ